MFDPKQNIPAGQAGPMQIEIPGKTGLLLVQLAQELGAKTPGEVIGQALGLMQLVQQAKKNGHRIVLVQADGREVDLAL